TQSAHVSGDRKPERSGESRVFSIDETSNFSTGDFRKTAAWHLSHATVVSQSALASRRARRSAALSRASFRRYDSPSTCTISALCTSRSTNVTTHVALGNTSFHSAKARFVVRIVGFDW